MKLFIKPTAAALAMSVMAFAGVSNAGNIQFNGQVTTQTCKSDIFGVTNPTIYLDSVAVTAFTAPNVGVGLTEFTISISGCTAPTATETITVQFQADGAVDADGNIVNTAPGGSANVALGLYNDSGATSHIALNGNLLTAADPMSLAIGQTAVSKKYYVGYVASTAPLSAVDAGPVTGSVNYVVRYP